MLYQAYQAQSDLLSPMRLMAQSLAATLWVRKTERTAVRQLASACELIARLRLTHQRPAYDIREVELGSQMFKVSEEAVLRLPFGTLLHFRKEGLPPGAPPQPKVLLTAPLSGHFSTLLRETVRTLLQDHDVYITDWHNARDVPLRLGAFTLDDYVDYLMRFSARSDLTAT